MYTLTVEKNSNQTFELVWEQLNKEVALRAAIILERKFAVKTGHAKFRVVEYNSTMNLYAKVTVEDCTPIHNLVNDTLREVSE